MYLMNIINIMNLMNLMNLFNINFLINSNKDNLLIILTD